MARRRTPAVERVEAERVSTGSISPSKCHDAPLKHRRSRRLQQERLLGEAISCSFLAIILTGCPFRFR